MNYSYLCTPKIKILLRSNSTRTKFQVSDRNAQWTVHLVYGTNYLMYREIIGVYSQIHTKHSNTLCVQDVEFLNVKPGGT
jgi:hypothetical protein